MWRCRRDRSRSSGGCPRPALGGRRRCRSPSRLPARARRRRRRHPETRARRSRRRQQPWRRLGRRQAPSRSHQDRAAYLGRRGLCDGLGQTRSPTVRVPRAQRAVRGATRSPTRSRGRIPAPRQPRRRSGRPGLRWTLPRAVPRPAPQPAAGSPACVCPARPQRPISSESGRKRLYARSTAANSAATTVVAAESRRGRVTATTAVVPSAWNCDRYVPDAVPITTRRRRPPAAPEWLSPPAGSWPVAGSWPQVVPGSAAGALCAPARIRTNATVMMRRPTGGNRRRHLRRAGEPARVRARGADGHEQRADRGDDRHRLGQACNPVSATVAPAESMMIHVSHFGRAT